MEQNDLRNVIMRDLQNAIDWKKKLEAKQPKNEIQRLEKDSALWTANLRIKYHRRDLKELETLQT